MNSDINSSIEIGDTGITLRGWNWVRPPNAKGAIDLKCRCELIVAHIPTELSPEQLQALRDAVDAMLQCVPRKHPADPI